LVSIIFIHLKQGIQRQTHNPDNARYFTLNINKIPALTSLTL